MDDRRILIVDDDENLRKTLYDILSVKGYRPSAVATGEKALEIVEREAPVVALIDLKLDDMSGLRVMEGIKSKRPATECIVLTGYASEQSAIEAVNLGAYSYLQKPYDLEQLLVIMRRAIEKHDADQALQSSEKQYRSLFESIPLGLYRSTADGQILAVNQALVAMLGYPDQKSLLAQNIVDIYRNPTEYKQRLSLLEPNGQVQGFETQWRTYKGKLIWIRESARLIRGENGQIQYYEGAIENVTEDKRAEKDLQDNLQKTKIAYEQATIYAQELTKEIVERKRVEKALRDAHDELEERVRERTLDLSEANKALQAEIQERERIESKLTYDALHDGLTALPNRTYFLNKVRTSIAKAKKHNDYLFAVLFLDLDRFKLINDSLGHVVGDELLIAVAARLVMCLDESEIVARLGGDEFAILLDAIRDENDAVRVAKHIHEEVALPLDVYDEIVFTTVSIGITLSTIGYDQPEECLRDADTAMYQAKANGRARFEIFKPGMHTDAFSLWQLDADLRHAVERQEFEIYYQPIVSLTTGQITGAEALLRWQHPQRGLLEPPEFMALAEETGLIVPIGEWTIRHVCRQVKTWHDQGYTSLAVAVNISARQFQHQDVPRLIKSALRKAGLPVEALVIEITESVATKGIDPNLASLYKLRAMGVKISIDDFGIGSALDCLKRFPLHYLKIDQSFVQDIVNDPANVAITKAIIDMAHSLNLTVIAEGVETDEQLAFLRSRQCDFIQGYLFSRPITGEAFTGLLQQGWQLTTDEDVQANTHVRS